MKIEQNYGVVVNRNKCLAGIYSYVEEKLNKMPKEKSWCNITLINAGELKVSNFYLKEYNEP